MTDRQGWMLAAVLALAWGLLPLTPAALRGEIPGSPWTDLYPSVWGLGWFASHATEGYPRFATEIAAPDGMPFVYASPLHGWVAAAMIPIVGVPAAYAIGVALARVATVACAYGAGRALGLRAEGGLVFAAAYGASPFFHGFTVEGIVEGTDGWALALWVWLAARERWFGAAVAAALVACASWYAAMCGALLAVAAFPWVWRASASFAAGLAVASPVLVVFLRTWSGGEPLDDVVRAAMGTPLDPFPTPGILAASNPFAKTSWIGWVLPLLAIPSIRAEPRAAALAVGAWVLSLGVGPVWELPLFEMVRFPYRLIALVLLALGFLAGMTVDRAHTRLGAHAAWAAAVVVLEGALLSPVEPIVPGAPIEVPAAIVELRGRVVLAVPGPVRRAPGEINPSRPRARYVLYWSGVAGTRTPWAPDMNALGTPPPEAPVLARVRTWDPLEPGTPDDFGPDDLRAAGIDAMFLVRDDLGAERTRALRERFAAFLAHEDDEIVLFAW